MRIVAIFFQLWPVNMVNWPSSDRQELNWKGGRLLKEPNGWHGKELNFLLLKKNPIKQQLNRNNHILFILFIIPNCGVATSLVVRAIGKGVLVSPE